VDLAEWPRLGLLLVQSEGLGRGRGAPAYPDQPLDVQQHSLFDQQTTDPRCVIDQ
jgi:hypothetical protein